MTASTAIHVIDDDEAVRHSLAFLLGTTGFPVRAYASGEEFLCKASDLRAGCVLTDVRMPGMDGLALQRRLADIGVRLPVIVMTGHGDIPIAVQALKAGAVDFIEKPFDEDVLLAAVRNALAASRRDLERKAEAGRIAARLERLTPRELQVFHRLVAGQQNKAIAHDLGASPRTVEVHRGRIMEKMAARNLSELVRMALVAGVAEALPPPD